MYPELSFFSFHLAAYPFFLSLALIVVMAGSYWFARRRGFLAKDTLYMLIGMGLAVFIGARLLNIIVSFNWYREDFTRLYSFEATGFSLYGGILAALIAGAIISKMRRLPLKKFADTVIPFMGLGVVIMRIGCFLNGCCFGEKTDLPWGVTFPILSPAHKYQIADNFLGSMASSPVHPTQLYELIAALLGVILAFWIIKKRLPDGAAFLAFGIWFSAFRWLNLLFRVTPSVTSVPDYFYPLFYAGIILVGGLFLKKMMSIWVWFK